MSYVVEEPAQTDEAGQTARTVDIAVIGAGLAGTAAAINLSRGGWRVALVDFASVHRDEFKAEKLGLYHLSLFEKLGLADIIKPILTPMNDNHIYRMGQLYSREQKREYGFTYAGMINALREAVPENVLSIVGKITGIEETPSGRHLILGDGSTIDARLVIVATGSSEAVRRMLGMRRLVTSKMHGLAFGFDLAGTIRDYPFDTLNYYAKRPADRYAYISFFPIGEKMRANFFVYRDAKDPWVARFRAEPRPILRELMPEIASVCGDFQVASPVALKVVDLTVSQDFEKDGVVLVGDAFCSTCPVPGIGINRVMTDVERLCNVYVPAWMATPGMGREKIAAFYRDKAKSKSDTNGIRLSHYSREINVNTSPLWRLRRLRNNVARRIWHYLPKFR